MGLISLDLPVIGQSNTTEDPKIRNDFSLLQTLVNGNIDGSNLSPSLVAQLGQLQVVFSGQQVRTVGESGNQVAGRVLTPADFTNMGLAAPLGLWNLSNTNDSSGNGRNLVNKGAVTFTGGITGAATEAAQFTGSTGQALYIADTGAADPFRIKTGSLGCWFRTARRGATQELICKASSALNNYFLRVVSTNAASSQPYNGASTPFTAATGFTDVCDDRWHFAVMTLDGTRHRLYVDAVMEAMSNVDALPATGGVLNIGSSYADGGTPATNAFPGRIDEAFITSDVLSDEQIRNLYCLGVPHTLGLPPTDVRLAVRRKKRGAALATTDFPSQPVRLHNFTSGSFADQGSGGIALAPVGGGTIVSVSGADGSLGGGYSFSGAHTGLGATDTGLPAGLAARTYGCWFKTTSVAATQTIISYGGAINSADVRVSITTAGIIQSGNGADIQQGPNVSDGLWHQIIVVEDNAAVDNVKRKGYLDGRLCISSTLMNSITLTGANRFRVGTHADGTLPTNGQIDGAFIFSGALTAEQVRNLYNVGSQTLAASSKDGWDHVEAAEATRVLTIFDSLEGSDAIDLTVVA